MTLDLHPIFINIHFHHPRGLDFDTYWNSSKILTETINWELLAKRVERLSLGAITWLEDSLLLIQIQKF